MLPLQSIHSDLHPVDGNVVTETKEQTKEQTASGRCNDKERRQQQRQATVTTKSNGDSFERRKRKKNQIRLMALVFRFATHFVFIFPTSFSHLRQSDFLLPPTSGCLPFQLKMLIVGRDVDRDMIVDVVVVDVYPQHC